MKNNSPMLSDPKRQFHRITSTFKRFELAVGEPMEAHAGQRHILYGELSGNPNGPVVLCLHGGPGAGSNPATRQFFDPDHYCIVQFDQRGAGRSRPWASMIDNSTSHLVHDIEAIVRHLKLDDFILFGGSWGSTLALSYAQVYPKRIRAMVLRGVFLGRPRDIEWFLVGVEGIYSEVYSRFLNDLSDDERATSQSILNAYLKRLMSMDSNIAVRAAMQWAEYEDAISTLCDNRSRRNAIDIFESMRRSPLSKALPSATGGRHMLGIARTEAYYLANNLFLPSKGLLAHNEVWNHIPGTIVHGRYDMVCQVQGALELANAWPKADLKIIDDAGHSTFEEGISHALFDVMEALKHQ